MPSFATNPQAQQAISDLAERLQIEPQTITVTRVEVVTWPNGSLGCPEPGMMYTQALIDGFFIQLQVGDQRYNYHSGSRGAPTLCESPGEVLPEDLGAGPA